MLLLLVRPLLANNTQAQAGSVFDDGDYLGTNTHVYRGCFFTNSQTPGEMFDLLALDGDTSLSVAVSGTSDLGDLRWIRDDMR